MGAMAFPLNSNLDAADIPNDLSGVSVIPPSNPSAAKGSSMRLGSVGGGGGADGTGDANSSSLTVSTIVGEATADAPVEVESTKFGMAAKMSIAGAVEGAGEASKDPKSSKSTSGADTGGAAAATGGGAAAEETIAGAGAGGGGAGARGGGGGAPGTIPPNKAAAMRSFSNCSGVFWIDGTEAGPPE